MKSFVEKLKRRQKENLSSRTGAAGEKKGGKKRSNNLFSPFHFPSPRNFFRNREPHFFAAAEGATLGGRRRERRSKKVSCKTYFLRLRKFPPIQIAVRTYTASFCSALPRPPSGVRLKATCLQCASDRTFFSLCRFFHLASGEVRSGRLRSLEVPNFFLSLLADDASKKRVSAGARYQDPWHGGEGEVPIENSRSQVVHVQGLTSISISGLTLLPEQPRPKLAACFSDISILASRHSSEKDLRKTAPLLAEKREKILSFAEVETAFFPVSLLLSRTPLRFV